MTRTVSRRSEVISYARANQRRFVEELQRFVRFPSVSGQPARAADVRACARWLAGQLRRIGMPRVRMISTPRHPIVYAEWCRAPGRPTLLIYGHYDVQPPDPVAAWRIPPFEPVVRDGHLYGRGASDDKGQLFTHLKAIEAYLRTVGQLPLNVKCLFEGEEEIGSPNLFGFLRRNRRALAADAAVISDTTIPAPDRPAITYSLRGGLGLELEVRGPGRELHSGHFGGAIHNPLQALSEILARLHDPSGRVVIPGFYDDVREVSTAERARMAEAGPADETILRAARIARGWGEPGYTLHERTTIRPALTINGIVGGYGGPGGKSVIPERAMAKISFRLVPDQHPDRVEQLFRERIARLTPPAVRATVRRLSGSLPVVLDREHPVFRAAADAYEIGFRARPVLVRSGGSVPIVHSFLSELGIPTALMGFGLPDDRVHAPNERFSLSNFFRGIETSIAMLSRAVAALGRRVSTEQ